jgi:hypothetical protein
MVAVPRGYVVAMSHTPNDPIDPEVVEAESLDSTDVEGRLGRDPQDQVNREDAPDPAEVPGPTPGTTPTD